MLSHPKNWEEQNSILEINQYIKQAQAEKARINAEIAKKEAHFAHNIMTSSLKKLRARLVEIDNHLKNAEKRLQEIVESTIPPQVLRKKAELKLNDEYLLVDDKETETIKQYVAAEIKDKKHTKTFKIKKGKGNNFKNSLLITFDEQGNHQIWVYPESKASTLGVGGFGKARLVQNLNNHEWGIVKGQEAGNDAAFEEQVTHANMSQTDRAMYGGALTRQKEPKKKGRYIRPAFTQHLMVQKLIPGIELNNKNMRDIKMTESEALKMMSCISSRLRALHDSGYLHRDIKGGNFIYDKRHHDGQFIDFGVSGAIDKKEKSLTDYPTGSPVYMPPEILSAYMSEDDEKKVIFDEKTEVYALGLTLAETLGFATIEPAPNDVELADLKKMLQDYDKKLSNIEKKILRNNADAEAKSAAEKEFETLKAEKISAFKNHPLVQTLKEKGRFNGIDFEKIALTSDTNKLLSLCTFIKFNDLPDKKKELIGEPYRKDVLAFLKLMTHPVAQKRPSVEDASFLFSNMSQQYEQEQKKTLDAKVALEQKKLASSGVRVRIFYWPNKNSLGKVEFGHISMEVEDKLTGRRQYISWAMGNSMGTDIAKHQIDPLVVTREFSDVNYEYFIQEFRKSKYQKNEEDKDYGSSYSLISNNCVHCVNQMVGMLGGQAKKTKLSTPRKLYRRLIATGWEVDENYVKSPEWQKTIILVYLQKINESQEKIGNYLIKHLTKDNVHEVVTLIANMIYDEVNIAKTRMHDSINQDKDVLAKLVAPSQKKIIALNGLILRIKQQHKDAHIIDDALFKNIATYFSKSVDAPQDKKMVKGQGVGLGLGDIDEALQQNLLKQTFEPLFQALLDKAAPYVDAEIKEVKKDKPDVKESFNEIKTYEAGTLGHILFTQLEDDLERKKALSSIFAIAKSTDYHKQKEFLISMLLLLEPPRTDLIEELKKNYQAFHQNEDRELELKSAFAKKRNNLYKIINNLKNKLETLSKAILITKQQLAQTTTENGKARIEKELQRLLAQEDKLNKGIKTVSKQLKKASSQFKKAITDCQDPTFKPEMKASMNRCYAALNGLHERELSKEKVTQIKQVTTELCASPKGYPGDFLAGKVPTINKNKDIRQVFNRVKIRDCLFVSPKIGGANDPGEFGGIYDACYQDAEGNIRIEQIFFKQATDDGKPNHRENIAEVLAGNIMRDMIGENAAGVLFAMPDAIPGEKAEAKDRIASSNSDATYVGSIFLHGYQSIHDAAFEALHNKESAHRKDKDRKKGVFAMYDERFKRGMHYLIQAKGDDAEGLLISLGKGVGVSLLLGNYQIHTENMGLANFERDHTMVREFGILDFGGAGRRPFSGRHEVQRGEFEREIHPNRARARKWGANYLDSYPKELRITKGFIQGLDEVASFSRTKLETSVYNQVDYAVQYYGAKDFIEYFAKELDTTGKSLRLTGVEEQDLNAIKQFLKFRLQERQFSLKKFALKSKIENIEAGNHDYHLPDLIRDHPAYFHHKESKYIKKIDVAKLNPLEMQLVNQITAHKDPYSLSFIFLSQLDALLKGLQNSVEASELTNLYSLKNFFEHVLKSDTYDFRQEDDQSILLQAFDEAYSSINLIYKKHNEIVQKDILLILSAAERIPIPAYQSPDKKIVAVAEEKPEFVVSEPDEINVDDEALIVQDKPLDEKPISKPLSPTIEPLPRGVTLRQILLEQLDSEEMHASALNSIFEIIKLMDIPKQKELLKSMVKALGLNVDIYDYAMKTTRQSDLDHVMNEIMDTLLSGQAEIETAAWNKILEQLFSASPKFLDAKLLSYSPNKLQDTKVSIDDYLPLKKGDKRGGRLSGHYLRCYVKADGNLHTEMLHIHQIKSQKDGTHYRNAMARHLASGVVQGILQQNERYEFSLTNQEANGEIVRYQVSVSPPQLKEKHDKHVVKKAVEQGELTPENIAKAIMASLLMKEMTHPINPLNLTITPDLKDAKRNQIAYVDYHGAYQRMKRKSKLTGKPHEIIYGRLSRTVHPDVVLENMSYLKDPLYIDNFIKGVEQIAFLSLDQLIKVVHQSVDAVMTEYSESLFLKYFASQLDTSRNPPNNIADAKDQLVAIHIARQFSLRQYALDLKVQQLEEVKEDLLAIRQQHPVYFQYKQGNNPEGVSTGIQEVLANIIADYYKFSQSIELLAKNFHAQLTLILKVLDDKEVATFIQQNGNADIVKSLQHIKQFFDHALRDQNYDFNQSGDQDILIQACDEAFNCIKKAYNLLPKYIQGHVLEVAKQTGTPMDGICRQLNQFTISELNELKQASPPLTAAQKTLIIRVNDFRTNLALEAKKIQPPRYNPLVAAENFIAAIPGAVNETMLEKINIIFDLYGDLAKGLDGSNLNELYSAIKTQLKDDEFKRDIEADYLNLFNDVISHPAKINEALKSRQSIRLHYKNPSDNQTHIIYITLEQAEKLGIIFDDQNFEIKYSKKFTGYLQVRDKELIISDQPTQPRLDIEHIDLEPRVKESILVFKQKFRNLTNISLRDWLIFNAAFSMSQQLLLEKHEALKAPSLEELEDPYKLKQFDKRKRMFQDLPEKILSRLDRDRAPFHMNPEGTHPSDQLSAYFNNLGVKKIISMPDEQKEFEMEFDEIRPEIASFAPALELEPQAKEADQFQQVGAPISELSSFDLNDPKASAANITARRQTPAQIFESLKLTGYLNEHVVSQPIPNSNAYASSEGKEYEVKKGLGTGGKYFDKVEGNNYLLYSSELPQKLPEDTDRKYFEKLLDYAHKQLATFVVNKSRTIYVSNTENRELVKAYLMIGYLNDLNIKNCSGFNFRVPPLDEKASLLKEAEALNISPVWQNLKWVTSINNANIELNEFETWCTNKMNDLQVAEQYVKDKRNHAYEQIQSRLKQERLACMTMLAGFKDSEVAARAKIISEPLLQKIDVVLQMIQTLTLEEKFKSESNLRMMP